MKTKFTAYNLKILKAMVVNGDFLTYNRGDKFGYLVSKKGQRRVNLKTIEKLLKYNVIESATEIFIAKIKY